MDDELLKLVDDTETTDDTTTVNNVTRPKVAKAVDEAMMMEDDAAMVHVATIVDDAARAHPNCFQIHNTTMMDDAVDAQLAMMVDDLASVDNGEYELKDGMSSVGKFVTEEQLCNGWETKVIEPETESSSVSVGFDSSQIPIQETEDGKKVICVRIYFGSSFSITFLNLHFFLDVQIFLLGRIRGSVHSAWYCLSFW